MEAVVKKFQYGDHLITLETGAIARQATAAVMASMGDTRILVTVVGSRQAKIGQNFLPLSVTYQERTYAAGRIPGGFFRREGRPSEGEVLISRLIDRPLRPLFPKKFFHEIQIIATVVSIDPQINPDIVAIIGASAAMTISGIPFNGPIAAARVGYVNDQYVLNPTQDLLTNSKLDLVIAGSQTAVLMVESEAKQLTESQMLGAIQFGHQQQQIVIENIKLLAQKTGKERWNWQPPVINEYWVSRVDQLATTPLEQAYQIIDKQERVLQVESIKTHVITTIQDEITSNSGELPDKIDENQIIDLFRALERHIVRSRVLANYPRIDNRDPKMVRALAMSIGILPRTHGSAIFTRGETQALVAATLGTERDAQIIDELMGERTDSLLVHYNFPPYAVGEVGVIGTPKRREIGHGRLAKRGLAAVMPSKEKFPYTVRVVSEITESNGSSSMATVCGASLALMDAGVPIKAAVAGIAMGLIKDGEKAVILSDILGDEDHLGDMDFKVAGTAQGITALQMDIKIDGISQEIMSTALQQAKGARLHILQVMNRAIHMPRGELSEWAPRIFTMRINPDKIREVIGKGGVVIRKLIEETGAVIDVKDDGTITISATTHQVIQLATKRIKDLTVEIEKGTTYYGKITRIVDFGAFVSIAGGKEGLVHISQLAHQRVEKVTDCVSLGQEVQVKVLEIDKQGRIRLSIKDVDSVTDTVKQLAEKTIFTDNCLDDISDDSTIDTASSDSHDDM